jgi:predicted nucleic acid-binding protein
VSGINYVADSNIILYILEGNDSVSPYLDYSFAISVISEIELLGWHKIQTSEADRIANILGNCVQVELLPIIKRIAIDIKQHYKIKLPDAIIAATAIHLDVPLLTADRGFEKIKNLDVLIIPV